jgi:hypothetical protein
LSGRSLRLASLTSSQSHRHASALRSKHDKRFLENVVPPSLFGLEPRRIRSPQGLRRLRFSFFLFTCQRTRWLPIVRSRPSPSSDAERDSPEANFISRLRVRNRGKTSAPPAAAPPSCGGVYSRHPSLLSTPRHK